MTAALFVWAQLADAQQEATSSGLPSASKGSPPQYKFIEVLGTYWLVMVVRVHVAGLNFIGILFFDLLGVCHRCRETTTVEFWTDERLVGSRRRSHQ